MQGNAEGSAGKIFVAGRDCNADLAGPSGPWAEWRGRRTAFDPDLNSSEAIRQPYQMLSLKALSAHRNILIVALRHVLNSIQCHVLNLIQY